MALTPQPKDLTVLWIQNLLVAHQTAVAALDDVLARLAPAKAVQITLALPMIMKKGVIMPNFELTDDEVATIPIQTRDAAGNVVPAPSGDTFTVTSSNAASLMTAIGTDASGNPTLVLTPLVQASPGLTVTVSDSSGLAQAVQIVDIVQDLTPTNIVLDVAGASFTPQPVPANPGP